MLPNGGRGSTVQHEGIGGTTSGDVQFGRVEEILQRKKKRKQVTIDARFRYNLGPAPDQTPGELRTEL